MTTHPVCRAPFTSMYLDPRGEVRACCLNQWQPLGNVAEESLTRIWHGARARRLREHLAGGDLSLGCELCSSRVGEDGADSAYLHVFDDLPIEVDAAWPRQLELALSNSCNLQCVMCNGELSSAIRIHRERRAPLPTVYDDAFFEDLDQFLPHLERVIFLGGEPFLGAESLRVMERLVERGLQPRCHVTTNGTQWSERTRAIVAALPLHVAVSIDGATAATVESIRQGVDFDAVRSHLPDIRDTARSTGGDCSIAFCLMRGNWHEFGATLEWAESLGLDVFVNMVEYPPRWSLSHLPLEELRAVVRHLDAEDEQRRATLGRNRPAWEHEVRRLRGMLHDRSVTVAEDTRVDGARRARQVLGLVEGQPLALLSADQNQIVRYASPELDRLLLPPGESLVGRSIGEWMAPARRRLGDTISTSLRRHRDGVEERTIELGDREAPYVVRAAHIPSADTQDWYLTIEHRHHDALLADNPVELHPRGVDPS